MTKPRIVIAPSLPQAVLASLPAPGAGRGIRERDGAIQLVQ